MANYSADILRGRRIGGHFYGWLSMRKNFL